jgi:hypothetical protein
MILSIYPLSALGRNISIITQDSGEKDAERRWHI